MSGEKKKVLAILILSLLLFWQISEMAYHAATGYLSRNSFFSGSRLEESGTFAVKADAAEAPWEREPFRVALTFDDGPHPVYTEELLDGLAERGILATFFLIGENIVGNETVVSRMAREGHLIGNHTYHHVQMAREGILVCGMELDMTNQLIEALTGTIPAFIRPPYGQWTRQLQSRIPMIPVGWDVDPLDWKVQDADRVTRDILNQVENGDIILLHDVYPTSVEAALNVADALKEQGWEFVTVDQLIMD